MVVADLFIPETNIWNIDVINAAFNDDDMWAILNTTPASMGTLDSSFLHFAPNEIYSIKSAHHLAAKLVAEREELEEGAWQILWRMSVPRR